MAQYLINSGGKLPRSAQLDDSILQETMVRVVCLQKAQEFGIRATDSELIAYLQSQPFFRNQAGQFDAQRYQQFVIHLNNSHITEPEFEEVMRQQLIVQRLQALIGAGAKATPLEVQQAYTPLHEQITIEYVAFAAAAQTDVPAVTDEESQAFYDKNKSEFRPMEKVNVRYVRVPFDTAAQVVSDDDVAQYFARNQARYTNTLDQVKTEIRASLAKSRSQRAAGDRATELTVDLVSKPDEPRPQFAKVAEKYNLPVTETGFFIRGAEVPGVKAGVDFNNTAFALLPAAPFSDPVLGDDGYYVLELVARQKSEIMPFADAKPQVREQVQKQHAYETALKNGQATAQKVKDALAAGKDFAAACAELKLTSKTAGPFNLSTEKLDIPGDMSVREATLSLPVGGVSNFIRTAEGGVFFYLKDRQPPTPEQFAKDRAAMTATVLQRNRETIWDAWLSTIWHEEQVDLGQPRAAPAPVTDES